MSSLKLYWNKKLPDFSLPQNQEIPQFLGGTVKILGTVLEMSDINTIGRLNDEIHTAVLWLNTLYLEEKNSLIGSEHLKDQESFYTHAFLHRWRHILLFINTVTTLG